MGRYVPQTSGGAGGGGAPAVTSTGSQDQKLAFTTGVLGAQKFGSHDQKLAQTAVAVLSLGTRGQSLAYSTVGADAISLGVRGGSMSFSTAGSQSMPLGTRGQSMTASSSALANGYVTTASTGGGVAWTATANIKADDGAVANWIVSDGVGAGTGTTSNGSILGTNPKLGVTPTGWTRTKVEALVHRNATGSGFQSGDSASFTVTVKDKTGATLQTLAADNLSASGTIADSTVATDITASVAAVTDSDLALIQMNGVAVFARTVAATGTRSFSVNVDSFALRVTYTRSGIS